MLGLANTESQSTHRDTEWESGTAQWAALPFTIYHLPFTIYEHSRLRFH